MKNLNNLKNAKFLKVQANVILKYSVEPSPRGHGNGGGASTHMVTIQAVVAMVTVPVAMGTGLVAMEI